MEGLESQSPQWKTAQLLLQRTHLVLKPENTVKMSTFRADLFVLSEAERCAQLSRLPMVSSFPQRVQGRMFIPCRRMRHELHVCQANGTWFTESTSAH